MFSDLKAPLQFFNENYKFVHCVHKKINFIFHSRNSLEAKSWKMTNYEMTNLLKNLHNKLSSPLGFRHATKMMPNYRVIYMSEAMIKFYCVHRNFFLFHSPIPSLNFSLPQHKVRANIVTKENEKYHDAHKNYYFFVKC